MKYNHSEFVNRYITEYKDQLSAERVRDLLSFNDNASKDTSMSSGQRLFIKYLYCQGIKPNTKEIFEFSHEFKQGVNVLIADNLKGKSTMLKVIKWGLTGSKIDTIHRWFHHILLSFNVNGRDYTVIIDNTAHIIKFSLYNCETKSLEEVLDNQYLVFTEKGDVNFKEMMQNFFFEEFNYYSLKWTQKKSSKSSLDLAEAHMSWQSYYSSIFLESKDSMSLAYGKQETKIFEMLMGLELTSIINDIKVKREKHSAGKAKSELTNNEYSEDIDSLNNQLAIAKDKYSEYTKNRGLINNIELYNLYKSTLEKYNKEYLRLSYVRKKDEEYSINMYRLNELIRQEKQCIKDVESQITKIKRRIIELNEYVSSKIFFSGLEITSCPNCNTHVQIITPNSDECSCGLCHTVVQKEADSKNITDKVSELEESLTLLESDIRKSSEKKTKLILDLKTIKDAAGKLNLEPLFDLDKTLDQILQFEQQITAASEVQLNSFNAECEAYIKQIGIFEDRISRTKSNQNNQFLNSQTYQLEINLLEKAELELKDIRYAIGNAIILKFRTLMLNVMQYFGFAEIEEVSISKTLDISFRKNNIDDLLPFANLVEGEQLRAKIALYMSLIYLDINEQIGRHPRMLIIDSPTKEEADATYIKGFIDTLLAIDKKYNSQFQMIIGTAEREFEGRFSNERVFQKNEYVF